MITVQTAKNLRPKLEKVLRELGESEGLDFKVETFKVDEVNGIMNAKLVVTSKNEDGEITTQFAQDFKKYCQSYGLKPEHLNQVFINHNSARFKIVGLRTTAHKYPILATCLSNNKTYGFSVNNVLFCLQRHNGE